MKRYLLLFTIMAAGAIYNNSAAQCNANAAVIYWPVSEDVVGETWNYPGNIAPIAIDGDATDWRTYLLGNFSGNNNSPYTPPSYSAANWSQDGISGIDDRDSPTSPRDLNFFAFTYDVNNVFFYFRRINNGNSQNAYYYFCDIMSENNTVNGPDGYMNNGEPVFRVKFTNGNAGSMQVEVLRYVVNTTIDYEAGKGNPMVSPVTGYADGYSMKGSILDAVAPTSSNGEIFQAASTEDGFGVEFSVPWSFFRSYTANSSSNPIPQGNIFTYHVSLLNGSDGISNAQDNAGGCCAGVAASGQAEVIILSKATTSATSFSSNTKYQTKLQIKEDAGASTVFKIGEINISDLLPSPLSSGVDPELFTIGISLDVNNDSLPDGAEVMYTFENMIAPGVYQYTTTTDFSTNLSVAQSKYILLRLDMIDPGTKSFKITAKYSSEIIATNSGLCAPENQIQVTEVVENIISPLPVKFSSFTAVRNKSNVAIKWETSTEINNRGFYVQRNINGSWENIAFVFSQADNGNSNSVLSYSYNDLNTTKGVTQYRIQQVDLDGKAKYSEIRSVRGEANISKLLVYPNPTTSGNVNVVFEDQSPKNVTVLDMSGRMIKQYRNVINNVSVDNLENGIYSIQVTDVSTATISVEKVVVKKR